jgi:hypothetical protein
MSEAEKKRSEEYSGDTNIEVRVEHGRVETSTEQEAKEEIRSMSCEAEEKLKDLLGETDLEVKVHSPILTLEKMG